MSVSEKSADDPQEKGVEESTGDASPKKVLTSENGETKPGVGDESEFHGEESAEKASFRDDEAQEEKQDEAEETSKKIEDDEEKQDGEVQEVSKKVEAESGDGDISIISSKKDNVDVVRAPQLDEGKTEREYPVGINVFSRKFVVTINEAAETILCKQDMPKKIYCTAVPSHAPTESQVYTFLIDTEALENPESVFADSHGYWGQPHKELSYFLYRNATVAEKILAQSPKVESKDCVSLQKHRFLHPKSRPETKLIKHVFTVRNQNGKMQKWAMVSFKWEGARPFKLETESLQKKEEKKIEEDEQELEVEVEDFGPNIHVFNNFCVFEFNEATEILLRADELIRGSKQQIFCNAVPKRAPRIMKEVSFLINVGTLNSFRELFIDSHGNWGPPSGDAAFYALKGKDTLVRIDKDGKLDDGNSDDSWDFKFHKARYKHPNTEGNLLKYVYTGRDAEGSVLGWALISYKWNCEPYVFLPRYRRSGERTVQTAVQRMQSGAPKKANRLQASEVREVEETSPGDVGMKSFSSSKRNPFETLKRRIDAGLYESQISYLRSLPVPAEEAGEEEIFPEGVEPFGFRFLGSFYEVVDVLLRMHPPEPTCKIVPLGASLQHMEIAFVVDLQALEHFDMIYSDLHGSWGSSHGNSNYFRVTQDTVQRMKAVHRRLSRKEFGRGPDNFIEDFTGDECMTEEKIGRMSESGRFVDTSANNKELQTLRKLVEKSTARKAEHSRMTQKGHWNTQPETGDAELIIKSEKIPASASSVYPYCDKCVSSFIEASDIMIQTHPKGTVSTGVPQSAPTRMKEATYVIDLQALGDPREIFMDGHGSWGKPSGEKAYYIYTRTGVERVGTGRIPEGTVYDVKIKKTRYKHPSVTGGLRKNAFLAENFDGEYLRWAIVSYKWDSEPHRFSSTTPERRVALPRAHVKHRMPSAAPYQPAKLGRMGQFSTVLQHTKVPGQEQTQDVNVQVEESFGVPVSGDQEASTTVRFPKSIHKAAALICTNADSAVRQFPTKENFFAVLDESAEEVQSHTVSKLGFADYLCACEEYRSCGLCRHSLAVAKIQQEGKEYLEHAARKIVMGVEGEAGEGQPQVESSEETHTITVDIDLPPELEVEVGGETSPKEWETSPKPSIFPVDHQYY